MKNMRTKENDGSPYAIGAAAMLAAAGLWLRRGSAVSDPPGTAQKLRAIIAPGSGAPEPERENARAKLAALERKYGPQPEPQAPRSSSPPPRPTRPSRYEPEPAPEWQPDKRSRFNEINRNDFSDINFLKRSSYEHAKAGGGKIIEVNLQDFDGHFPRNSITLYTSLEDLSFAVRGFEQWGLSGHNARRSPHMHAVVAMYNREDLMYLVSVEGESLGARSHPIEFERDEDHLGSLFNSRAFVKKLKDTIRDVQR